MSQGFYVTLPSNASKETFPENSQGQFSVKLENAIDMSKYAVGMVDIQYPTTWLTLKDAEMSIQKNPNSTTHTGKLLDARYTDFDQLMLDLNNLLRNYHVSNSIDISYDKRTMLTSIRNRSHEDKIAFNKPLAILLGFKTNHYYEQGIHKSEYPSDLDSGMTSLFVYSNIVQNQLVGDTNAPLLRSVPLLRDANSNFNTAEFRHVRYLPLNEDVTDIIQIDIRRDTGDTIPFTTGKVIVTLHFVPKTK